MSLPRFVPFGTGAAFLITYFLLLRRKEVIMELTELKLEYAVCDTENSGIPVIIAAAGASARMEGINKQKIGRAHV